MSSILTNNSAMVALQTLKGINKDLSDTQSMISTGKSIASAKDNASVWAISKVMEADVKGFNGIQDSLSLGESTLSVAANASETVTDLLTDIKGKIVAAQESNVDREKIQTDIDALTDQIKSVVGAAQFNGLNLVQGTEDVNILSSLDRSSDGSVTASDIKVSRQDLTTSAGVAGTTALTGGVTAANYGTITDSTGATATTTTPATGSTAQIDFAGTAADGNVYTLNIEGYSVNYVADVSGGDDDDAIRDAIKGQINALGIDGLTATDGSGTGELVISNTNAFEDFDISIVQPSSGGTMNISAINAETGLTSTSGSIEQRAQTLDFDTSAGISEGDTFKVTVGSSSFNYVAGKGETMEDVAKGLKTAIDSNPPDGVTTKTMYDEATGQWSLAVDDSTGGQAFSLAVTTGGEASGGLFGLDNLDVSTNEGASAALDNIETLITNSIDAAANFGSAQGRIETQKDFIEGLTDALKSGIGTMVDADMEEASARLQALQVQQQLGIQSLSIANQAPQSILSLFR
ncbi:flagellin [Aliiroseovarius sp. PTFE2010]|uniref:flagellin N-terminal helical domain-containing protein n=1 Tax=Aliiroseovarius sp. PTFE2010 TaxID=3417190 RepID=UPI003CFB9192